MELLIEEFLINFPLILSLILQSKLSIESSKGIYSIYLFSFTFIIINLISNDFPSINQSNKFAKYINLGDPIAVLGPLDSVLGSVDLLIIDITTINCINGGIIGIDASNNAIIASISDIGKKKTNVNDCLLKTISCAKRM